jgi:hypothetical protein
MSIALRAGLFIVRQFMLYGFYGKICGQFIRIYHILALAKILFDFDEFRLGYKNIRYHFGFVK